jgi:glycosyltransferase involved in cell wall biosynthesis
MKIAFFTNTILEHGGGLEKYFIEMTAALSERYGNTDFSIITFNEKRTELLQHLLSFYYLKKMPVSNIYREKTGDIIKKLGRVRYIKCDSFGEVKTELQKYDVIYTKNEIVDLSILKSFGYMNLPPVIVGMHTPVYIPNPLNAHDRLHNFLYTGFLYKFLLQGTKMAHVINSDDLKLLQEKLHYPLIRKILLPFHSNKNTTPTEVERSPEFHILFVGRLTAQKGIDILLECIEQLSQRDDFALFRFRIVGSGELDFVERFVELSEKYANVEYVGHVPNSEITAMYKWSDVVIIPSRCETANYVALEAGSSGRIVVVSDIPGPRETVSDGETGFLAPVDVTAFRKKIEDLYDLKRDDFAIFGRIGMRAVSYIDRKFDPDTVYVQFLQMLQECCKELKK